MKKFWLSFFVTCLVLTAVIYGVERGKYSTKTNDPVVEIDHNNVPIAGKDSDQGDQEVVETGNDEVVMLLLGMDRDPDLPLDKQGVKYVEQVMKEKQKAGEEKFYFPTANRSDVIYLAKFNKKTGKITMLSIPRDTRTNIGRGGGVTKLNAAYSLYGPYGALDAVRNFTKVDVQYFVLFDYNAVAEAVDSIGGVDFEVPFDMNYDDPSDNPPLHIDLKKGMQHFDGKKAIGLLRWRKNNSLTKGYLLGDVGRIKTQQEFIKTFLRDLVSVKNLPNLPKIANHILDNIYTNLPMNEFLSMVTHAKNVDMSKAVMDQLPGDGDYIGGISYFIPFEKQMREQIFNLFKENLIR